MPHLTRARCACAIVALALAAACAAAMLPATGSGASTSVLVTLDVTSATSLNTTACTSGTADTTAFGTVLPGTKAVTGVDCAVAFGSTNNTSMLQVSQTDRYGSAMYRTSRGTPDTTFDSDGAVVTPGPGPAASWDAGMGIVAQPDGKLVVGGSCGMGANQLDFCVARYNVNGTLDTTFDGDGFTTVNMTGVGNQDVIQSVALQADGKIVASGWCDMSGGTSRDICVARFNANGSLDTTFSGDGKLSLAIAPGVGNDEGPGLAIQADGRIVVAGKADMGGATGEDAVVARYLADGTLDTSFGTAGIVTLAMAPSTGLDNWEGVIVQPDQKLMPVGRCEIGGGTGGDFCVARLNVDGSLDTTFASGVGWRKVSFSTVAGGDWGRSVARLDDGRYVLGGFCNMGGATGNDQCIARLTPAGVLDTTFDSDGRVTVSVGDATGTKVDYLLRVLPLGDGRVVGVGYCDMNSTTGFDVCAVRVNDDGSLDPTFGTGGIATFGISPGNRTDTVNTAALLPDGRIGAVASCDTGGATGNDLCVLVWASGGTVPDYVDNGTADWDTAGTTTSLFGACLRAVSGGATGQWTTNATCPATDGTYWNDIPTTPEKVAYNTAVEPDPADATAMLRFGVRTTAGQATGSYVAPITFDVLAPNA